MEASTIKQLLELVEMLSVPGVILGIVWWLERRFTGLEKKHDEEINSLKSEHNDSLSAQRSAHIHEKTQFFGSLNDTLRELIKEIQISNDVRNKIVYDMNLIINYQDEVIKSLNYLNPEQEVIKSTLFYNNILSALIKHDLNDEKQEKLSGVDYAI